MSEAATSYVPGVCNINTKEIARRKKAGYFGLALTLILVVALFGFGLSRYFRIILFVPIFISAIGFLQAKNKFCVGYAGAGQQNADESSDNASKVSDKKAISADKKRARAMNLQALLIATALTVLTVAV